MQVQAGRRAGRRGSMRVRTVGGRAEAAPQLSGIKALGEL